MPFGVSAGTAAIIGGGLAAGGAVGAAALTSSASSGSAQTIANSANRANQLLEQQQQQTATNLAPFLGSGTNALSALNLGLGLTPTAPAMTGGTGPTIADLIAIGAVGDARGDTTNTVAFGPAGATNAPVYQLPAGAAGGGNPSTPGAQLLGYLPGAIQGTGANPSGQGFTTLAQLSQQQQAQGGGPGSILQSPLLAPPTLAQFQADPGYQFQLQQGINAIQNSAAAGGGVLGGNTLSALQEFGTGLANQDYQTFLANFTGNQNRALQALFGLTGAGQNAAVSQGGFGANAAGAIGNNVTGAGSVLGAGQVGSANAISGGLNNFTQFLNAPANTNSTNNLSQILQLLAQNQNNPSGGGGFLGTLGGFAPQFGNLTQGVDPGMTGTF